MSDTMLTHNGITQPITEWALDYGIYPSVITDRLARGWTTERAITTPMIVAPHQRLSSKHFPGLPKLPRRKPVTPHLPRLERGKLFQHDGSSFTLKEWSGLSGISTDALRARLRRGMTMSEAIALGCIRRGRFGGWSRTSQPCEGTGGGSVAQDIPQIELSE